MHTENKAACCLLPRPTLAVKPSVSHRPRIIIGTVAGRKEAEAEGEKKKKKKRPRGVSLRKRGVKIGDFAPCIFSPQVPYLTKKKKVDRFKKLSAKPAKTTKITVESELNADAIRRNFFFTSSLFFLFSRSMWANAWTRNVFVLIDQGGLMLWEPSCDGDSWSPRLAVDSRHY